MVSEVDSFTSLQRLLQKFDQSGLSSKMWSGSLIPMTGRILESSSQFWMNSGIVLHGEFLTVSTSEHPSVAVVRSLSQVLKQTAPPESFLTTPQLEKWMDRHASQARTLPPDLQRAIETQISTLFNTRRSAESQTPARKQRDSDATAKPTPSTAEDHRTLFVRRMLASEYEALQGFPENWTDVDSEH